MANNVFRAEFMEVDGNIRFWTDIRSGWQSVQVRGPDAQGVWHVILPIGQVDFLTEAAAVSEGEKWRDRMENSGF